MKKEERKTEIAAEYLAGGVSYRFLSRKYGLSLSVIWKYVHQIKSMAKRKSGKQKEAMDTTPNDIKKLQKELEKERLKVKLLNAMIDIAEEDLGVKIRKKAGARRS